MNLNDCGKIKFNGTEVDKVKYNGTVVWIKDKYYISFEATDNKNFTLSTKNATKNWAGTLEYSTNGITWSTWAGTNTLSSSNGKLYLRGTNNNRITGSTSNKRFVLGGDSTSIECNGNIETLLDYQTVASGGHPSMTSYCFSAMFQDCEKLVSTPELLSTTLGNYAYYYMFNGCTNLTKVSTIDNINYANNMFAYCSNLTSLPTNSIPAIDMTDCTAANYMLQGCSNLQHIYIYNLNTNLDISASTKFTSDSLYEIIDTGLKPQPSGTSKTLTMGATNLAKLDSEQIAVATTKGWTLA